MKSRYLPLLVLVALLGGYALGNAGRAGQDAPDIIPGTVVSGIVQDHVSALVFVTAKGTFTAQRSRVGGPFAVQLTFADGRPARHCTASPDLSGQLLNVSTFEAKRQLSFEARAKDFPVHVGNLFTQPQGREPGNVVMVYTNEQRSSVAVVFDRYAVELIAPPAAFDGLEAGCNAFAQSVEY